MVELSLGVQELYLSTLVPIDRNLAFRSPFAFENSRSWLEHYLSSIKTPLPRVEKKGNHDNMP